MCPALYSRIITATHFSGLFKTNCVSGKSAPCPIQNGIPLEFFPSLNWQIPQSLVPFEFGFPTALGINPDSCSTQAQRIFLSATDIPALSHITLTECRAFNG